MDCASPTDHEAGQSWRPVLKSDLAKIKQVLSCLAGLSPRSQGVLLHWQWIMENIKLQVDLLCTCTQGRSPPSLPTCAPWKEIQIRGSYLEKQGSTKTSPAVVSWEICASTQKQPGLEENIRNVSESQNQDLHPLTFIKYLGAYSSHETNTLTWSENYQYHLDVVKGWKRFQSAMFGEKWTVSFLEAITERPQQTDYIDKVLELKAVCIAQAFC